MTPRAARLARAGLVALMAATVGGVALAVRRPPPAPVVPPVPPSGLPVTRTENVVRQSYKGEDVSWVLQAKRMIGRQEEEVRLEEVELTFSYVARGEADTSTIRADRCLYDPKIQRAAFEGNVRLRTAEGYELDTETLVYRGDKGISRSDKPVAFRYKRLRGTSTGMEYRAETGALDLVSEVALTLEGAAGQPPLEIAAASGHLSRQDMTMALGGGADVRQGPESLRARDMLLGFSADGVLQRLIATEEVALHRTSGELLPGTAVAAHQGMRWHLTGRKLDVTYREDRTLEGATAWEAHLTMFPPGAAEKRRLSGLLVFRADAQGRIEEVLGQRDVAMSLEQLAPADPDPRILSCRSFVATLVPETGDIKYVEMNQDVRFTHRATTATSQKGYYEGETGRLILQQAPRLVDTERRTELEARAIHIETRTGDIGGRQAVRHVIRPEGRSGGAFLGGGSEPLLLTGLKLDYVAASRQARYAGGALLRAGRDEVRGDEIVLAEGKDGTRTLEATGHVFSRLHPQVAASAGPDQVQANAAAPVEARAGYMKYEEGRREAVYRGEVSMRQGEVALSAPGAVVALTPDGKAVRSVVAGEPVEIRQGARVASGAKGTYTPLDGTMVLVGEKVVLKDGGQVVQGRALTFNVGSERILVDGREQVRTETVFRREPPRP